MKKSIWTESRGGFSPLMFALGAATFAMVPSRKAVLCEGASDTILLPTLLREATGSAQLDFQIAPGLASLAQHDVPDLDLEAPRVVYLLDGDEAGDAIAAKLRRGRIPPVQIFRLDKDCVVEDYVSLPVYLAAVEEEIRRSHGSGFYLPEERFDEPNRPAALARWCADVGLPTPPKVAIAERMLERAKEAPILDVAWARRLVDLHAKIEAALSVGFPGR